MPRPRQFPEFANHPAVTLAGVPHSPRNRRAAVLASAAAVVFGVSSCSAPGPPEITVYADGRTAVVRPVVFCSLDFTRCVPPGQVTTLSVPPGYPLQLSVPTDIGNAPWRLITVFSDAQGQQQVRDQYFRPGERLAVTVRLNDPAAILQGVEIQLPSGATDAAGNPVARGAWSVQNDYTPHG